MRVPRKTVPAKPSEHKGRRGRPSSPREAAQRFVETALQRFVDDFLDLSEELDLSPEHRHLYREVEGAVRFRLRLATPNFVRLRSAIIDAVPTKNRAAVGRLVETYIAAEVNEQGVSRQAAYVVGVVVGRMLSPFYPHTIGDGLKVFKPDDNGGEL